MAKSSSKDFLVWTDDEVVLLLKVTQEYKALRVTENTDWESVSTKYADILKIFRDQYPSPGEAPLKDFPHKATEITKVQLTAKLKAIRGKYKKAVHSGKRNGHGRVVLLYFEYCEAVWGGCSQAEPLSHGVQSMADGAEEPGLSDPESAPESTSGENGAAEDAVCAEPAENRRRTLGATLGGHRRDKLKRKLSHTDESLALQREELDLRRQMVQQLEAADAAYLKRFDKMSSALLYSSRCLETMASSFKMLVQHIVASGSTAPHATHATPHTGSQTHGHSPTRRSGWEDNRPAQIPVNMASPRPPSHPCVREPSSSLSDSPRTQKRSHASVDVKLEEDEDDPDYFDTTSQKRHHASVDVKLEEDEDDADYFDTTSQKHNDASVDVKLEEDDGDVVSHADEDDNHRTATPKLEGDGIDG